MPRPPSSRLGPLTLVAALLAPAGGVALDALDVVDVSVEEQLALALTVLGVGLLVGAWRGRAPWLLLVGALLVPVLVAVNFLGVPLDGGAGMRAYRPESVAALPDRYQLAAGEMTLDLSQLRPRRDTRIAMTLGAGALEVVVPSDVPVQVDGHVRMGVVDLFGNLLEDGDEFWQGPFTALDADGASGPRVVVDIDAGVASVLVRRDGG